jgi:hypothetical protein
MPAARVLNLADRGHTAPGQRADRGETAGGPSQCGHTGQGLDHHLHAQEETVTPIQPQDPPTRRWHPTWADVNTEVEQIDSLMDAFECRIENLERSLTDRRYRRQLRREIRRGQRLYAWAGSWRAARTEVTTWQWLNRKGLEPADLPPSGDAR